MDLILWRHAHALKLEGEQALDAALDLQRPLTAKGHAKAKAAGKWLQQHMSAQTRILCSPALRCQETARYLEMDYKTTPALKPQAQAQEILELVKWPVNKQPVLVIGHQPWLGECLGLLLGCPADSLLVQKASIWWLRHREKEGPAQTVVVAALSPAMTL